jgi:hypothetical protein
MARKSRKVDATYINRDMDGRRRNLTAPQQNDA